MKEIEKREKKELQEKKVNKLQEMVNFYKDTYIIKSDTTLNHNDVLAFCYQYGKGGVEKLQEIAGKFMEQKVYLESKTKNDIVSKIVYPIRMVEVSLEFKEEMIKVLQEKSKC